MGSVLISTVKRPCFKSPSCPGIQELVSYDLKASAVSYQVPTLFKVCRAEDFSATRLVVHSSLRLVFVVFLRANRPSFVGSGCSQYAPSSVLVKLFAEGLPQFF